MTAQIQRLECQPNDYPWGEVGNDSLAAVLAQSGAAGKGFKLNPKQPYAELWMGTHPKSPAMLYGTSTTLSDYLARNIDQLGDAKRFSPPFPENKEEKVGGEGHVPFLFKILTCKQALPLQIHPDKKLAEKLHKENPDQFPDTNHKPEIAVCLSDRFLGFASFRPLTTIQSFLSHIPELERLPTTVQANLKAFTINPDQERLRRTWQAFIGMEGKEVEDAVTMFAERVGKEGVKVFEQVEGVDEDEKHNLVEAVGLNQKYYPGDGGMFSSIVFMNLVELKKGEGMYVPADGAHAWLCGEIVELMAASDNVLNVGFTPEKDSTSLVAQVVTCKSHKPSEIILHQTTFTKGTKGHTTVYATPFEEFSILCIKGEEVLKPLSGCGIAIVTASNGTSLNGQEAVKGSVHFVPAGTELRVEGLSSEVWMAFYDGDEESKGQVGKQ